MRNWVVRKSQNQVVQNFDAQNYKRIIPCEFPRFQFTTREIFFPREYINSDITEGNFIRMMDICRNIMTTDMRIMAKTRAVSWDSGKPGVYQSLYFWADDRDVLNFIREYL